GGLNEPPRRPMRMPLLWRGMAWEADRGAADAWFNGATAGSRPRLPGAVDAVFETGQLLGADRTAGVKFPGGDADFRAEAEFAAVGKLRRCVMQHDCRIDLVEEFARGGFVLGHERVRVLLAVLVNVRDRFIVVLH